MHEIDMLKKLGTKKELGLLNFIEFNHRHEEKCIYGQMTGDCGSKRAKELMDKGCIRIMDINNCELGGGVSTIDGKTFTEIKGFVNGVNEGQGWRDYDGYKSRVYKHLSALEGYICLKGANTSGIIAYLKGEVETVKL